MIPTEVHLGSWPGGGSLIPILVARFLPPPLFHTILKMGSIVYNKSWEWDCGGSLVPRLSLCPPKTTVFNLFFIGARERLGTRLLWRWNIVGIRTWYDFLCSYNPYVSDSSDESEDETNQLMVRTSPLFLHTQTALHLNGNLCTLTSDPCSRVLWREVRRNWRT